MQVTEAQAINFYQKPEKISDLFSTRKTFFAPPVHMKPCHALKLHKSSRNVIQAGFPHQHFQDFVKDSQNYDAILNIIAHGAKYASFINSFVREKLKKMNVNLPPAETEELMLALVSYYEELRKELEASRTRTQEVHELELASKWQALVHAQDNHNQSLLIQKEVHDSSEKRLAAEEQRRQERHTLDMLERKNMCAAIKEVSSQQNLFAENTVSTCKGSDKEEQKHEE